MKIKSLTTIFKVAGYSLDECVRSLEFDDITFENVVDACQKYFAAHIDKDMFCDILAGEREPPFKKTWQIPDHKVFYVLFMCLHRYPAAKFSSGQIKLHLSRISGFQQENTKPFSIKRIIFIVVQAMGGCIQYYILVVITYFTYLASENSSVIASKQGFMEVTETGTQSAWNEQAPAR